MTEQETQVLLHAQELLVEQFKLRPRQMVEHLNSELKDSGIELFVVIKLEQGGGDKNLRETKPLTP